MVELSVFHAIKKQTLMLENVNKNTVLYTHAPPNPSLEYVESIEIPKGITHIISQGGGSTIDVGKWLAHKFHMKHTAIPTTAGTGSEVTKYCVLMVKGHKVTYDLNVPDSYVLDPRLVTSLPELHTLSSGLDAISQACESLWSTNATMVSRNYATLALQLLFDNLKPSMEQPLNEIYRMNMLIGANLSGRAINITKTNICHAISYPLTELYNIPHGIACGMSLKYFASKMGMDLSMWFMQFNLPRYEIDREKIADIVLKNDKIKSYPHLVTREDIIKSML